MPEKALSKISLCNKFCAALMLLVLILQFLPFWHFGDDGSSSIQGYVWSPDSHKDLTAYLQTEISPDFIVDKLVLMPVVVIITFFVGMILCWRKHENHLVSICPVIGSAFGVWGYLAKPVFRLGNGWQLHLLICAAILIISLLCLIYGIAERRKYLNS